MVQHKALKAPVVKDGIAAAADDVDTESARGGEREGLGDLLVRCGLASGFHETEWV